MKGSICNPRLFLLPLLCAIGLGAGFSTTANAATLDEVAIHANVVDDVGHVDGIGLAVGFVPDTPPKWLTFLGDELRYDLVAGRYFNSDRSARNVSFAYLGPTWIYHPNLWADCYAEFGTSVGWLSRDHVGGRNMGGHFQFTSHGSLGRRFGQARQWRVGLRIQHTSNAGFEHPNPGLDSLLIEVGYRL